MSEFLVAVPGTLPMAEPLWPERSSHKIGDHPETIGILERWARGERVHPYGFTAAEEFGWDAAYHHPQHLDIRGVSDGDRLRWSVYGWRRGDEHAAGRIHCSGYSHPADACYSALTMIEEHEREQWEAALVLGLA